MGLKPPKIMNRPTFEKTVDILVKAYLNGTLAHKLCTACAIGNLVAATKGTKPKELPAQHSEVEFDCFAYENGDEALWWGAMKNSFSPGSHEQIEGLKQIEATGYSISEVAQIEDAFENAPGDPSKYGFMFRGRCVDEAWMFNGLMAVVDVLAEIHGVDLEVKESAKLLFVKP